MTGRLARVEVRRYLARAGVRWLVIGMVAAVLVTGFAAWRSSRPPTEGDLAQAQATYELQKTNWEQFGAQLVADCRNTQEQARQRDPNADLACDQMAPTVEQFLPHRATFADAAQGWLSQVATFLLLLSLIVGATFVAAEFSTGAMSTWLTFEPRRGHVFGSKAVVVTLMTGIAALVVSGLAVGVFWAATAINHATGHTTGRTFTDLGSQSGRIAVATAGAALLGAALGFLTRHTAAVIAVVIGWLIAIDGIVLQALMDAPRWGAALNLQAWLSAGYEQTVGITGCITDSTGITGCNGTKLVITMTQAGLALAALIAVVTALALVVFRRRDVA